MNSILTSNYFLILIPYLFLIEIVYGLTDFIYYTLYVLPTTDLATNTYKISMLKKSYVVIMNSMKLISIDSQQSMNDYYDLSLD